MRGVSRLLGHIDVTKTLGKRGLEFVTFLVYFFLYAPVVIVIVLSFTESKVPQFPMEGFTLKWYYQLIPPEYDAEIINSLVKSLQIAVLAAVGSGIVGTITALGMVRGEFESRWLRSSTLNTAFLSPIVVPWVVTGIAVLTLFSLIGIQGSFLSVVIGHVLITLPFVVLVVSSQLYGFDRSIEEAAMNLGASELRTFYEITLPLILPGVVAGMLFAFTISFDNFTQTFFWLGGGTQTLPIVIFSSIKTGIEPTINAIGTVIVAFSLVIATTAELLSQRLT